MSTQTPSTSQFNKLLALCAAFALGLLAAGCAAPMAGADLWPELQPPKNAAAPTVQPGPTFTVEIVPEHGNAARVQFPHTPESHVQDALDQSRAVKKFRRMTVEVLRPDADGSGRVDRMAAKFNSGKRQVSMLTDYSLYPGDVVRVTEDTSTILDDIVEKSLGLSTRAR